MLTKIAIPMLLATACSGSYKGLETDDGTPSNPALCDGTIRTIAPASDGQANFYFRDDIVFSISEGAENATITLTNSDGLEIEGTTWLDEQVAEGEPIRVVFTPDEPLAPQTEHVASLNYCDKNPSVRFQTSMLGLPIENPQSLDGWTYTIDLSKAKVAKPGNTAQALLTLVDNHLALQVNELTDDTIDVTIAPTNAESGLQDTCIPSLHAGMPNNFKAAPTFMVGPINVPFTLAGYSISLYDAIATATFAADGSYFAGGTIAGSLDARDIVDALAGKDILPIESPDAVCDIIANAKLPCTACADGEEYCLYLEVRDVSGAQNDTIIEVVDDLNCHSACANSCDNEACEIADDFAVCSI